MMADSGSISDFKITVKMDTSGALKSLNFLNKRMEAFANRMNTLVGKVSKLKEGIDRAGDAQDGGSGSGGGGARKANKWATALKGVKGVAGGVFSVFKGVGSLAGGILKTLWSWKYAILGILGATSLLIVKMAKSGAKMQSAEIAMKAAVGISMAQDVDPEKLFKEQLNQKNFAQNLAGTYGFNPADTVSSYAKFFTAATPQIGAENVQKFFTSFSKLATVFGLDKEKVSRSMVAFQQMADKGQVMAEELKQQLAEQLPGAMIIFARAAEKMGKYGKVDVDKLYKLMEQGLLKSKELLPLVADEMDNVVNKSGALSEALNSTQVQLGRLQANWEFFQSGVSNQYVGEIVKLFDKLGTILGGVGFQTVVGKTIEGWLISINKATKKIEEFFEKFEKAWGDATNDEKKNLLESFWQDLGDVIYEIIGEAVTNAFNAIKETDISPFTNMVAKVLSDTLWKTIKDFTGISWLNALGSKIGIDLFNKYEDPTSKHNMRGKMLAAAADVGVPRRELLKLQHQSVMSDAKLNITVHGSDGETYHIRQDLNGENFVTIPLTGDL